MNRKLRAIKGDFLSKNKREKAKSKIKNSLKNGNKSEKIIYFEVVSK